MIAERLQALVVRGVAGDEHEPVVQGRRGDEYVGKPYRLSRSREVPMDAARQQTDVSICCQDFPSRASS